MTAPSVSSVDATAPRHHCPGDATSLLAAIDTGRTTARDALEACLERINELNSSVNAVVYLERTNARRVTDRCDQQTKAGRKLGPLHGIPVTVKECFDWAGRPSTRGDPARKTWRAARNSIVVEGLEKSGAVILGKTNVPACLRDWETDNPLFGPTRNPHDRTRGVGGSSGGSAAAVACGMSYADIGSDQGGSIRLPAHSCGVFGLKPSWGLIPMRGHSPLGELREPDIGVAGPITRSSRDAALFLDALSGSRVPDVHCGKRASDTKAPHGKLRVAVFLNDKPCPVDAAYLDRLEEFVEQVVQTGAAVDREARPEIDLARHSEVMNPMVKAETSTRPHLLPKVSANAIGNCQPDPASADNGTGLLHRQWLELHEERLGFASCWKRFLESYDLLICPAGACCAPPLEKVSDNATRTVVVNGERRPIRDQHFWFGLASLTGLPAISMSMRRSTDEPPAGVQLVSARNRDLNLCRVITRLGSTGE